MWDCVVLRVNSSKVTKSMPPSWWEQNINCGVPWLAFLLGELPRFSTQIVADLWLPAVHLPLAAPLQEADGNVIGKKVLKFLCVKNNWLFFLLGDWICWLLWLFRVYLKICRKGFFCIWCKQFGNTGFWLFRVGVVGPAVQTDGDICSALLMLCWKSKLKPRNIADPF